MKLAALIMLASALCAQPRAGLKFLWPQQVTHTGSTSTFALNAAANHYGAAIQPLIGGTLSKVRLRISATAGTLDANDLECGLYATSSGVATGSVIETKTATASGASTIEFTGFTTSLAARTLYWFTFRNLNATPATNSATVFRSNAQIGLGGTAGSTPSWGDFYDATSTNSGSSWTTAITPPSLEIEYSNGVIEGLMLHSITSTVMHAYSGREPGIAWRVFPGGVAIRVIGITAAVVASGTPTSALRYRLYAGAASSPVLLGTTSSIPGAQVGTGTNYKPLYFDSPIVVNGGTVVTATISEDGSGSTSSTNRFQINQWTVSNASNWGHTGGSTYRLSTDNGASFSVETADRAAAISLILDERQPYVSQANGGFTIQ